MCGKKTEELYNALVEGISLKVCEMCAKHGKITEKVRPQTPAKKIKKTTAQPKPAEKEITEAIAEDFAKKIRDARSKSGLTQKEFAKKINEKESLLHKLETGAFTPPILLAKKLQKILQIKLVEEIEEEITTPQKSGKEGPLTIGDLLKL